MSAVDAIQICAGGRHLFVTGPSRASSNRKGKERKGGGHGSVGFGGNGQG